MRKLKIRVKFEIAKRTPTGGNDRSMTFQLLVMKSGESHTVAIMQLLLLQLFPFLLLSPTRFATRRRRPIFSFFLSVFGPTMMNLN